MDKFPRFVIVRCKNSDVQRLSVHAQVRRDNHCNLTEKVALPFSGRSEGRAHDFDTRQRPGDAINNGPFRQFVRAGCEVDANTTGQDDAIRKLAPRIHFTNRGVEDVRSNLRRVDDATLAARVSVLSSGTFVTPEELRAAQEKHDAYLAKWKRLRRVVMDACARVGESCDDDVDLAHLAGVFTDEEAGVCVRCKGRPRCGG